MENLEATVSLVLAIFECVCICNIFLKLLNQTGYSFEVSGIHIRTLWRRGVILAPDRWTLHREGGGATHRAPASEIEGAVTLFLFYVYRRR